MYRVKKRDGSTAAFNIKKVASAIRKAFDACDREYTDSVIDLIALRITSDFEPKIQNSLIDVEKIQDSAIKSITLSVYQRRIFSIVNSVKMYVILQIQHLIIILLWTIISIQEISIVKVIQLTLLVA